VDIPYSAAGKVPRLGGLFPGVFHAAFADGSVHALDKQIDEAALRRLITRADGQVVDLDAFTNPVLTSDPEQLRRENKALEAEIARARQELMDLRRRAAQRNLDAGEGRATVQVLRQEQKRLLRERDELRREADRLRDQLGPPRDRLPEGGKDG
jgi:chromosome segregation ATPase